MTRGEINLSCPLPIAQYPNVLLAHGSGGKLMHRLIGQMFLPAFDNTALDAQHDASLLQINGATLAFTTDSFVVSPIFFPGGDIGELAVYGTVNDLAMSGARPLCLSLAFILEEGFPMEELWRIVQSVKEAAEKTHVQIITGDTKVVDRGKGDGIFINTSGIGVLEHTQRISPQSIRNGDKVLVSGDLGRHGIAVMATREGLAFETEIKSDAAPLWEMVEGLFRAGIDVRCLRDLTRGGLATALNEIAETAKMGVHIEEKKIPVQENVRAACEILGLDPLYVANEGRFVVFVPEDQAEKALGILRSFPDGRNAMILGEVIGDEPIVTMKSRIGANRIVDMLSGEQLPRIC